MILVYKEDIFEIIETLDTMDQGQEEEIRLRAENAQLKVSNHAITYTASKKCFRYLYFPYTRRETPKSKTSSGNMFTDIDIPQ